MILNILHFIIKLFYDKNRFLNKKYIQKLIGNFFNLQKL